MSGAYNESVHRYFYRVDYVGSVSGRYEQILQGGAGSRHTGTHVVFTAGVNDGLIAEMKFQAFGCPHTLSACALAVERLTGCSPDALMTMGPADLAADFEVPDEKTGRLLIIEDALRKCRAAWDNRGLA